MTISPVAGARAPGGEADDLGEEELLALNFFGARCQGACPKETFQNLLLVAVSAPMANLVTSDNVDEEASKVCA